MTRLTHSEVVGGARAAEVRTGASLSVEGAVMGNRFFLPYTLELACWTQQQEPWGELLHWNDHWHCAVEAQLNAEITRRAVGTPIGIEDLRVRAADLCEWTVVHHLVPTVAEVAARRTMAVGDQLLREQVIESVASPEAVRNLLRRYQRARGSLPAFIAFHVRHRVLDEPRSHRRRRGIREVIAGYERVRHDTGPEVSLPELETIANDQLRRLVAFLGLDEVGTLIRYQITPDKKDQTTRKKISRLRRDITDFLDDDDA